MALLQIAEPGQSAAPHEHKLAIGIDLGTTFSCVGVWRDNKVDILLNEHGKKITPSCVAFLTKEDLHIVGDAAVNHSYR